MAPPTAAGALLDEDVYRRALMVGRRAAGVSGPNPPVGCVLVRDGDIVGEGSTRPVGEAHAEVVALGLAGDLARGATAVVTLEPCAHHGRTPPCVDALVAAGVAEVHLLLRDPDPQASGGAELLSAHGVRVVDVGALRPDLLAEAAHDLRGFVARVRHGRPHVTLKLAQDVHGRTTPPPGGYLTGEDARRRVHAMRAASDAVLVGGGTVRVDDPRLDVRDVASDATPRPVVVTWSGDIPRSARVLRPGAIVVTGERLDGRALRALEDAGVRIVAVPEAEQGGGLDVAAGLAGLLAEGILTVLAEPGPRLASTLLVGGLVDVVELHVAGGERGQRIVPCLAALTGLVGGAAEERAVTADGDLVLRASARPVDAGAAALGAVA